MDNLKMPVSHFYGYGEGLQRALKGHILADAAGRALIATAYQRQHIIDAKEQSYYRRTYSSDYLNHSEDGSKIFLTSFDQVGPRWVKDCQEVYSYIRHNGWYTDADGCGGTLIGVVLCLTRHGNDNEGCAFFDGPCLKAKGHVIYMAGTRHTDWDGVTLGAATTDNPEIAARWADAMAECEAESCREEDERYQAEQQAEEELRLAVEEEHFT